jgi:hypothetical protein
LKRGVTEDSQNSKPLRLGFTYVAHLQSISVNDSRHASKNRRGISRRSEVDRGGKKERHHRAERYCFLGQLVQRSIAANGVIRQPRTAQCSPPSRLSSRGFVFRTARQQSGGMASGAGATRNVPDTSSLHREAHGRRVDHLAGQPRARGKKR